MTSGPSDQGDDDNKPGDVLAGESLRLRAVDEAYDRLGKDAELHLFLEMCRSEQEDDPRVSLPALRALEFIAACWNLPDQDAVRPERVEVPLWIVETMGFALSEYRDSVRNPPAKSFGEILGIEGGGQGKQPALKADETGLRNIRIVISIALLIETQGCSIERAIELVQPRTGIETRAIWRAWEKHGERARATIANHLATTSRSDDSVS